MKIKITRDSYCFGTRKDDYSTIGDCCAEDCEIDVCMAQSIETANLPCLTKEVAEGEPFFFGVTHYSIGLVSNTSNYYGQFETLDGILTLKITHKISGARYQYRDGDKVFIFSHQPTDLSLLPDHRCSILTSDALICLEEDSYIGYKDGHVDELSASELLEQLSRHDAERSPHYERVELSPLTRRPKRPRQGTLIFNKVSKKLELFNGKSWQTMKTED